MDLVELVPVAIFLLVAVMVAALASLMWPSQDRVWDRIRRLAGNASAAPEPEPVRGLTEETLARMVAPEDSPEGNHQNRLQQRLLHAGYRGPRALAAYQAARWTLLVLPWVLGLPVLLLDFLSWRDGLVGIAILSTLGLLTPGLWLESRGRSRQAELRQGLPDFFDILVLCLEGGMAITAAWRRVTDELRGAYPILAEELRLVGQETELGRPMGEALWGLAERTGLNEIESLAGVIGQSERLGTELSRPLRSLSDSLRLRRVQQAEEAAHKTGTKILFPTLLFIFPGVFAIILGPIAGQVMSVFGGGR